MEIPEVLLFIVEAGGGHRAAANALLAAAEEAAYPLRLRVVSLNTVLARIDFVQRLTGLSMERTYNDMVQRRWTGFLVPLLRVLHGLIRLCHRPLVRLLAGFLAGQRPAAVVSLLPNFNAPLRDAVHKALPGVPFVILLTDYADFPPHFWIEPGVERIIVGSEHAARQGLAAGLPAERIRRTSGMLLHPRFYGIDPAAARAQLRREWGLGDDGFVVLVLFGGKGSAEIEPLAARLLAADEAWHVVAICGDNPRLYERLAPIEAASRQRLHRVGFTSQVSELMAASDLLVTKPGPGSLAEAFHRRLPVVVVSNRYTVPQERFNARLVAEQELGLVVSRWQQIPEAAARLAADAGRLARLRAALAALPENRAVYEALRLIADEAGASGALDVGTERAASG